MSKPEKLQFIQSTVVNKPTSKHHIQSEPTSNLENTVSLIALSKIQLPAREMYSSLKQREFLYLRTHYHNTEETFICQAGPDIRF